MLFGDIAASRPHFLVNDTIPVSLREIILHSALGIKDRSNKDAVTEEVLRVLIPSHRILGVFKEQSAQHRNACLVRLNGTGVKVRHEGVLELNEMFQDLVSLASLVN